MRFSTGSFLKLAIVLGVAGLFLGAGIAFLLPSQYTSHATLLLTPSQIGDDMAHADLTTNLNEQIQRMQVQVLSRTTLAGIVNDPRVNLYKGERRQKPLEDVIEEMRRAIRIEFQALPGGLGRHATAFNIVFTYFDRYKAQLALRALVNAFEATHQYSQQRPVITSQNNPATPLEVLDAASFPDAPSYPRRPLVMLSGFLGGLLLAGLLRVVRRTGFIAHRFALVTVVLGFAGLAVVGVADKMDMVPYQYRSVATMRLRAGNAAQASALTANVLSRTTLSTVIDDSRLRLYSEQWRTQPLEDVIETMTRHLSINTAGNVEGPVFTIAFDYPDQFRAQMTVNAIVNHFEEANTRLYPSASATPPQEPPSVLEVLDPPSLPLQPTSPNRFAMALTGCICGLGAAIVIAMIRNRWKPETQLPLDAVSG